MRARSIRRVASRTIRSPWPVAVSIARRTWDSSSGPDRPLLGWRSSSGGSGDEGRGTGMACSRAGWRVERVDAATSPVAPGTVATRRFAVTVAPDAPRSQPYFLRRPLVGALYDWGGVPADWRGLPFEPGPLQLTVRLTVAGEPAALTREVVYRYRDQSIGEVRRPVFVTRPFDVAVTPDLVV